MGGGEAWARGGGSRSIYHKDSNIEGVNLERAPLGGIHRLGSSFSQVHRLWLAFRLCAGAIIKTPPTARLPVVATGAGPRGSVT